MDIIIAFGVLAALFLGVTIVVNKPVVGFVAIGTFSAIASDFPQLPAVVRVVGLNIYPGDGIAVIVLLAALVHPRSSVRRSTIISLLAISIVGLAFLNLLRGASDFGLSASVNESRLVLWLFCVVYWGSSLDWSATKIQLSATRASLAVGWTLVFVGLLHALLYGVGGASDRRLLADGSDTTTRILFSGQAMTLILCFYVCFVVLLAKWTTWHAVSCIAFLSASILSQNRSVWFALLLSAVLLFLMLRHRQKLQFLGYTLVLSVILLSMGLVGFGTSVYDQLQGSFNDDRTYASRESGWTQLIDQQIARGPVAILFGQPFGSGFRRVDTNGLIVEFSPHNWYVLLFLRIGLLGLLAVLTLALVCIARIARGPLGAIQIPVLVAIAVYGWAYSIDWYIAPFLGWILYSGFQQLHDNGLGGTRASASSNAAPIRQKSEYADCGATKIWESERGEL